MKTTLTTGGLAAALALGVLAVSTLPAEAGRARSGARIGPFPTSGAHASVTLHPQPKAWSGFAPSPPASSAANSARNAASAPGSAPSRPGTYAATANGTAPGPTL
jgi:hypothetical protein